MILRELPKNQYQTVHPFPWLFAREQEGDIYSRNLLDQEIDNRFVYNGGLLVYVTDKGNWNVAAEILSHLIIRNEKLWQRACNSPSHVVYADDDRFTEKLIQLSLNQVNG